MLLSVFSVVSVSAETTTNTTDEGFGYEIANGEVTITDYAGSATELTIPNMINGLPVTQIDNYAFYQMEFINSVSIGKNLLYCGYAFEGCTNLSAINVSDGNDNYCSIDGILFNKDKTELIYCPEGKTDSYIIPDSVEVISGRAFCECEKITSVTIPDSVTTIGEYAFRNTGITALIVPDSVTYISGDAFQSCKYLKSVTLGDGITSINDRTFGFCESLTDVDFGLNITSIGNYAFSDCDSLETINLSERITDIGDSAFSDCDGLTVINISSKVSKIGTKAFDNCQNLTAINVDSNNSVFSSTEGVMYNKDKSTLIVCPGGKTGQVVLGDSVINISNHAFYNCNKITDVVFGNNLKSIGISAFESCDSITNVDIPDNVLYIGDGAFSWCEALKTVTIGKGVEEIGDEAFHLAIKLERFEVDAENTAYCSKDGVLFDKEHFILIQYPSCKENINYSIPAGTISIAEEAFNNCKKLCLLVIPASVTDIGEFALATSNIKFVEIGKGLANVNYYAFPYSDMVHILYYGTQEEWNNISINTDNGSNGSINTAEIHYEANINDTTFEIVDPSCTENGKFQYSCTLCNREFVETLSALVHSNVVVETIAPTCTDNGYTVYQCSTCGEAYNADWVYSTGHTKGDVIESVNPSCTQDGYTRYNCSVCGVTFTTDWVWAQGHMKGETVSVVDPTCEESGYTIYSCSVCGLTFKSDWIYSDGHTQGEVIGIVEATCTKDGYIKYQCSSCEEEFIDNWTYATGHSGEVINSIGATCIEKGYTECLCDSCGETYNSDFTSPLGHTFENDVCVNCNKAKEDCIESLHNYENDCDETWVINKPNAEFISITFSSATELESGYDYIYIYGMNDDLIGQYTGAELASQTVTVTGNIVKIRLASNDIGTRYGFSVSDIRSYIKLTTNDVDIVMPENTIDSTTELKVDRIDINNIVTVLPEEYDTESANAYDIYFEKDNQRVQLNGEVTVYIPVQSDKNGNNCKVFHIDETGKATDMNAVYEDGDMAFTTDHFSIYVVVESREADSVVLGLLGDANEDGKVNIKDATAIQKHIANLTVLTEKGVSLADTTQDRKVNIKDATAIQKHIAGIETGFRIGEYIA